MEKSDLKQRTKEFAVETVKLYKYLEANCGNVGRRIGDQLLRSGTSVYTNYRAACRCKSAKDFIHKIGTVVEECDETLDWLELLVASNIIKPEVINKLLKEADELTAIMTSSKNTAINNHKS